MSPSSRQLTVVAASVMLFLLLGSQATDSWSWTTPSPASAQALPSVRSAGDAVPVFPDPDPAVLQELESGRYWHATRLLDAEEDASPLLRAEAEAGWGNWSAVWDLLEEMDGILVSEEETAWALRGRAAEELARSAEAVESYRRALAAPGGLTATTTSVLRIRLARTLAADGRRDDALVLLDRVTDTAPWAVSWLGLELARTWSEEGEVVGTRRAMAAVTDGEARRDAWDLLARAHLASGDTASALDAYLDLARSGDGAGRRATAWSRIGEIRLARNERDPARRAMANALAERPIREAAVVLVDDLGLESAEQARRAYRALRRGDEELALEALDRYVELRQDPAPLPDDLRLERAELLYETDRFAEASEELDWLTSLDDMEIAAPALDLLASVRRRQGLRGEARTFQDLLVRRFPSHPDAVDVVFFRADDLHDRQAWDGALASYGRAVEMAPESDRAGLARMRMGQIHLTRGSLSEAAEVYEGYLDAFPSGRRWDEARYWAAWSRRGLGDADVAREHVTAILERDPLSYYAILGLRLLDRTFAPDVPEGSPPPEVPEIEEALERLEILKESGLAEGVEPGIDALRERYDASADSLLRLSLELSDRGFTMDGILVGWEVQSRGRAWDRWLVRAVYPFPYRELVRLEAEEWGLDPFYLAALIRQESAFLADARSGAGAMGLMQVIPSTGESMARSVGPEAFADHHLLHPEVNLHLGAAFLARLNDRFGDRSPLVLAAYNAGPTRASRWERSFPESRELERFTERIPYEETRGYVKRVTRNVELYRWLYGSGE